MIEFDGVSTKDWTQDEWNTFRNWLKGVLQESEVYVTFTKKDGSQRIMYCTLNENLLPKTVITENKKITKVNNDILKVFDLECNQWRSFIVKNVTQIKFSFGKS